MRRYLKYLVVVGLLTTVLVGALALAVSGPRFDPPWTEGY